ncbi:toxin of toxin-antitoxin system [Candidatus Peribacteria bacterium RIFCSPHIGHO2_01_FULL_55_13]|nr:MAG: toxin of toxin-antitoxin system [Candidatus Peribacteria bacterium RIFCSPHIGHO2_01_FULL_55_13]OGJ65273.1 MAG: toxin of toxin-antitoxin system [Candidatus Peribacteria bacterium RIFCSPHIGHO2_12_FULL_55_11]
MTYRIVYTKQAQKDAKKLKRTPMARKARKLLERIADDPFCVPPPFERLLGDLEGAFSRRINIQHRLVYQVLPKQKVVKVLRLWTHYE